MCKKKIQKQEKFTNYTEKENYLMIWGFLHSTMKKSDWFERVHVCFSYENKNKNSVKHNICIFAKHLLH